jgi:circadian clock protein KaiC
MVRDRLLSSRPLTQELQAGESAIERTSTGLPELDDLLGGGFPANRAVVVCGSAGTGKTMFGLQFLARGLETGEPGAFVTVDEKPRHLLDDGAALWLDVRSAVETGALVILDAAPYFTATRGRTWKRSGIDARRVASDLVQQVSALKARRLVIDSMTSLVPNDMSAGEAYDYLRSVIFSLEDNLGCTIMLTCRAPREDPQRTCDAARHLASGVVELRFRRTDEGLRRVLRVRKMRATWIEPADYPFTIEPACGLRLSLPEPSPDAIIQAVSA